MTVATKGTRMTEQAAPTEDRIEVQRRIDAAASDIFELLCDPDGHVAIDASGMLMSASGEPVAAVGDSFVVHMDRDALGDFPLGRYDVEVTIKVYEPGREIAWTPMSGTFGDIGHRYGYRLEPHPDGGTLVTSYYDWSAIGEDWRAGDIFPVIPESALRATLGILARTVQE